MHTKINLILDFQIDGEEYCERCEVEFFSVIKKDGVQIEDLEIYSKGLGKFLEPKNFSESEIEKINTYCLECGPSYRDILENKKIANAEHSWEVDDDR